MAEVTLMTTSELNSVLSRVDGDADIDGFAGFELIILIAHLKQTEQLEFMSDWYTQIYNAMLADRVLDEHGNITQSMYSLFWKTAAMPVLKKPNTRRDEG